MESFRKIAWIDTFPGPVRVGCSDTARSFLEYATMGAEISYITGLSYGMYDFVED